MGLRRVYAMAIGLVGLLATVPNQTTSGDEARRMFLDAASALSRIDIDISPPAASATTSSLVNFVPASFEPASRLPAEVMPLATPPITNTNPFGRETEVAPPGALWEKWSKVRAEIDAARPAIERCRRDFRRCTVAMRSFTAIIGKASRVEGRARLAIVNRGINAAVTYTSDVDQWQRDDVWSAPLGPGKTGLFDTGKGDCEDYAIAKYVALREAGTAATDLQILMVKDTAAGNDHAALAARIDGQWLILDNRWSRLLDESEATFFRPLFALSGETVKRFGTPDERVVRLKTRKPPAPA